MPEIFDSADLKKEKKKMKKHPKTETSSATLESKEKHHRQADDYSEVLRGEVPSNGLIAAYAPKPENISFSTQGKTETILLLLRQHPITQLGWVTIAVIIALVPVIFSGVDLLPFLPPQFAFAAGLGWYLFLLGFILESFLKWFFNVYIVTDERIIDVDFHSLIYKDISAAKIDNIEDTTASTGGFWASLFDYGSVTIQTAAEKRQFEFGNVPHPNRVTSLINELILEEEREKLEGRVS